VTRPEPDRGSASDLADELSRLPRARRAARFRLLEKDTAAAVFDALDPVGQAELLDGLRDPETTTLFEGMDPDDRVRLLDEVPAAVARRLVSGLSPDERRLTDVLLGYPPESAGRIMTPEYLELRSDVTAEEALAAIRRAGDLETLQILPIRDASRMLCGVLRLPALVRAAPEVRVGEVMDPGHPVVSAYDDQEPVARLMQEADLLAVPVVDRERRLVGVVTVDDAMEVLEREETEDLQRVAGLSEPVHKPYHSVPTWRLVRARVVWLSLLVAAATLTVSVLGAFEATLAQAVTLALFIPLLIGTGGNVGAQAATTMTRALAVGDVRWADTGRSLWKELRVGLSLGLIFAAVGVPVLWAIWDLDLALTVSVSLLVICMWATSVGAMLPMLADRVGIDPAVVSAPFVTTLVDATGLLIYFAVAHAVLL
jgi:magnesium transporter